jgi:HEAT repeat protein
VTFQVIQRIGPSAIPLLVDLLRHESGSIRRGAISELIDLAPPTESIQPALRRALRDEDYQVAGDAARALSLIRFRGHLPKGGYDVQSGKDQDKPTRTTTVHG